MRKARVRRKNPGPAQPFRVTFICYLCPPIPFPWGLTCFLDMVRCGPGSSGDLRTSPVVWMAAGPPTVVPAGLGTLGMVKHGG